MKPGRFAAVRRMFVCCFWLALWQLASLLIRNRILLVGPADVFRALLRLSSEASFYRSVLNSFGRIALGFLAAFASGVLLGSLSFRFPLLGEFLEQPVRLMKSVPVASFVILALIWIGSRQLSVFIAFTVVFPVFYLHTAAGLRSADKKLLEMMQVFHVGLFRRIRYFYLPTLRPFLANACELALGMGWKSGVAAEVIGLPADSVGERLYLSKIYLETADLFAWTAVIIAVSAACERAVLALLNTPGSPEEKKP